MHNDISALVVEYFPISDDELKTLCRKYQIRKLALFGSVLREDFDADSDVEVLVEFEPEAKIGFFELIDLEMELSNRIGRKVDLNTYGFLSPYIQLRVREQERVLYES